MKSKYTLMAEMFKALGDENRLKLLEELKYGEMYAGALLEKLSVTQPTLSHHMKILCDSGIVDSRKDGKWTYYKISEDGKRELLDIINSLTGKRKKPELDMGEILSAEIAEEDTEAAEEAKEAKAKKSSGKKPVTKKKTDRKKTEEFIPEAVILPEEIPEEEVEEPKEEKRERSMPSWLF